MGPNFQDLFNEGNDLQKDSCAHCGPDKNAHTNLLFQVYIIMHLMTMCSYICPSNVSIKITKCSTSI